MTAVIQTFNFIPTKRCVTDLQDETLWFGLYSRTRTQRLLLTCRLAHVQHGLYHGYEEAHNCKWRSRLSLCYHLALLPGVARRYAATLKRHNH